MSWFNFFTQEIAIDLGTANTLIIHNDKVVVDEPSIVAKTFRLDSMKGCLRVKVARSPGVLWQGW